MEKSKQASSGYSEAITTRVKTMEPHDYEACRGVICKTLIVLVHFLWSYDVNRVKFSITFR